MKNIKDTIAVNRPALDIPVITAEKSVFIPLLIKLMTLLVKSSTTVVNHRYNVGKLTAIARALKNPVRKLGKIKTKILLKVSSARAANLVFKLWEKRTSIRELRSISIGHHRSVKTGRDLFGTYAAFGIGICNGRHVGLFRCA